MPAEPVDASDAIREASSCCSGLAPTLLANSKRRGGVFVRDAGGGCTLQQSTRKLGIFDLEVGYKGQEIWSKQSGYSVMFASEYSEALEIANLEIQARKLQESVPGSCCMEVLGGCEDSVGQVARVALGAHLKSSKVGW